MRPYVLALGSSLVAVAVEFALDGVSTQPIYSFLPGFTPQSWRAPCGRDRNRVWPPRSFCCYTPRSICDISKASPPRARLSAACSSGAEGVLLSVGTASLRWAARVSARSGEARHRKLVGNGFGSHLGSGSQRRDRVGQRQNGRYARDPRRPADRAQRRRVLFPRRRFRGAYSPGESSHRAERTVRPGGCGAGTAPSAGCWPAAISPPSKTAKLPAHSQ